YTRVKSFGEAHPAGAAQLNHFVSGIGELSMKGQGTLSLKDEDVIITFESIMEGYVDYTPDSNTASYLEVNEVEPHYSGERKLFQ
ncbi:MAG: hypothetical protein AAFO03_26970, partial [Bacteroidota bacterium]